MSSTIVIIKHIFSDYEEENHIVVFKNGTYVVSNKPITESEAKDKLKQFLDESGVGSQYGDFSVHDQKLRFPDRFVYIVSYCYDNIYTCVELPDSDHNVVGVGLLAREKRSMDVGSLEVVDAFGSK